MSDFSKYLIGDKIDWNVGILEEEIPERGITVTVGMPSFHQQLELSTAMEAFLYTIVQDSEVIMCPPVYKREEKLQPFNVTFMENKQKPIFDHNSFWIKAAQEREAQEKQVKLLLNTVVDKKPKDWYRKFEKKKRY